MPRIYSSVFWLSLLTSALAGTAALQGLLGEPAAPLRIVTARGGEALLFGAGPYRFDSLFAGAGFVGQDAVTLFLAIPLLLACSLAARREHARWELLQIAALGFFAYAYASMAFSAAFNALFLVYVAAFSSSSFALGAAMVAFALRRLPDVFAHAPRRGPAAFLVASGVLTLFLWTPPILEAQLSGRTPPLLDHYTTLFTFGFDLALITPSALLSGVLILRRRAAGYLLAAPLLGIILLLAPTIVAATISQRLAGIVFTPAEMAGPVAGFVVLGALGGWVLGAIVRRIPGSAVRHAVGGGTPGAPAA